MWKLLCNGLKGEGLKGGRNADEITGNLRLVIFMYQDDRRSVMPQSGLESVLLGKASKFKVDV